jgi:hypothetical protein
MSMVTRTASRPLRILHVANFTVERRTSYYSVSFKLTNGLVRAGHNVVNLNDREVARAATPLGSRAFGVGAANRKLLRLADALRPDLVLFGHADIIRPETLATMRTRLPDARFAQWNVDQITLSDNVRRIRSKLDLVDHTFVTTAGEELAKLGRDGHPVAYMPNPVDPSIERSRAFDFPREALHADIFFASSTGAAPRHHCGIETTADATARLITEGVPGIRTDFPGLGETPLKYGTAYEGVLESTAMALNLSRRNDTYLYSSDRIAQLMGSGLLTFIDRATGFDLFFREDEAGFYGTEAELVDKIRFYYQHDNVRREVASAGWARYHRLFDSSRVARFMLAAIYGEMDAPAFDWRSPDLLAFATPPPLAG